MSFWPTPLIWAALAAACAIPASLCIFSLLGMVRNCGSRYMAACACGLAAFIAGALACLGAYAGLVPYLVDLIAGLCIVLTAAMLFETFWSLLSFGFTMNILLNLSQHPAGLTEEGLEATLGAGQGVAALLQNRALLLKRSGLVRETPSGLVLNGFKGRVMSWVGRLLFAVFNVKTGVQAGGKS